MKITVLGHVSYSSMLERAQPHTGDCEEGHVGSASLAAINLLCHLCLLSVFWCKAGEKVAETALLVAVGLEIFGV